MSNDTFETRMNQLASLAEPVYAYVNVDQVYARYQDGMGDVTDLPYNDTGVVTPTEQSYVITSSGKPKLGINFDHPKGGNALYLSGYITVHGPSIIEEITKFIDTETPMADISIIAMEDVAANVDSNAPIEIGILARSASVHVNRDNKPYYKRDALIPRLSQSELNALRANRINT